MLVTKAFSTANIFEVIVYNGFAQCSARGWEGGRVRCVCVCVPGKLILSAVVVYLEGNINWLIDTALPVEAVRILYCFCILPLIFFICLSCFWF